jgi:hypothetical protein
VALDCFAALAMTSHINIFYSAAVMAAGL